jgi:hypothetical protein
MIRDRKGIPRYLGTESKGDKIELVDKVLSFKTDK